ncbi:urease accessory protein UreF [Bartonella sp. HY329]|uniref:urease accessory protein UreF n=1 Tax=unclassified Bartonella TaxID=2645622 RepID=UPI0021C9B59E|nr:MULTISPECIES: urease accessory protein UreF [unclassified Bartonella]UXM95803.1 urease accessory protein UreF [Bartonella sp. HY329]UXN10128.1 urease accessory protein UreF [Bartonella sp. HY328]
MTMHIVDSPSYLRLLTLLSPTFPIGGFAYSHGLEQAVHDGYVSDSLTLVHWLKNLLEFGSIYNDAVLLHVTYGLVKSNQPLEPVIDIAFALSTCRERQLETELQGKAFLDHAQYLGFTNPQGVKSAAYPIAVAIVAAFFDIPVNSTMAAFLHGFISNLVQVSIRLGVIGQIDGVKTMQQLQNTIASICDNCQDLKLEQLGSGTILADICAMRHENLVSRIFRS